LTADGSVRELLDALARWVTELLPDAERGRRLIAAARDAAPDPDAAVDADICARLAGAARREARHLELEYVPDGSLEPDGDRPGPEPVDPAEIRRRAGSVTGVSRDGDGVATLTLDALDDHTHAAPYVDAAFGLVRGGRGLLLDLRANRGGDPATAALVIGWLLGGARVQLSTVVLAGGERPLWTPGLRSDRELAATPVAVLTSGRTFASAEGLAYHLRARRRATVVGEPTGGAADQVTTIRLTRHVRGLLPCGYVIDARTGENWEGAGVPPDIECPAAEAPARARAWLAAR
jgi:C-terminal processing protease CtpA/Prc